MVPLLSLWNKWRPRLLILAGIALATVVAYWGTTDVSFVFDDIVQIRDVPHNQPWTLDRWIGRRALPHFTFDANVWLGGLEVFGFHIVNITLHIVTAWLIFWLAYELLPARRQGHPTARFGIAMGWRELWAGVAGLLFALHPVQTEAVTYIVQRITILAALWYVAALLAYIRFRKTSRLLWAAVSLGAGILAMHSKENSITLPFAIVALEATFFASGWRQEWRGRIATLIPWLLLLLIIPANILGVTQALITSDESGIAGMVTWESVAQGTAQLDAPARATYTLTQLAVLWRYLRLLAWPVGQNVDHDVALVTSPYDVSIVVSAILLIAFLVLAVGLWRRKNRLAAFGIFFFFLALLPESSIFPLAELLVEYRLYLPLVGAALFVASLGYWYVPPLARWPLGGRLSGTVLGLVIVASIIGALMSLTWARNQLWRDPIALWQDSVAKSPHKARPYNNLGQVLSAAGRMEEGIEAYQKALALDPTYVYPYANLGTSYASLGRFDEAAAYFEKGLALEPRYLAIYHNLGLVYQKLGKTEAATNTFLKALEVNPKYVSAWVNLGVMHSQAGRYYEARWHFQQALRYAPDHPDIYNEIGATYARQGRLDRARLYIRQALEFDPDHVAAKRNWRNIHVPAAGLHLLN